MYELEENKHITNKRGFCVDDVVTTGYTLAECAAVLMKHGAKKRCCAELLRADQMYIRTHGSL